MSRSTERGPGGDQDDDAHVRDAADLARGVLVNVLGILVKASRALFVLFAAHFYGAGPLGLYFLATGAGDVASRVARFGLDRSLVREATRRDERSPGGMLRYHLLLGVGLALVVGALLALAAGPLAHQAFEEPALAGPIRLVALGLPLVVALEVLLAAVRARRRMAPDAIVRGAVEPLALLGIGVGLYFVRPDTLSLVASQVGAWLVALVAASFAVRRILGPDALRGPAPSRSRRRAVVRFSLPLAAMDGLNILVSKTDLFLVGVLMGGTSVGVYGLVVELISVVKRVKQAFEPIIAPIVAELHHAGDQARLARHYGLATRWLLSGSLLPLLVLTLFAPEALAIFDVSGHEAEVALVVLAVAHTLVGAMSAAENLLVMGGLTGLNALLALGVGVINVVVGWLLIPRFGIIGAAVGSLAAYSSLAVAWIVAGRWYAGVHPFGRHLVWPLVSAAIAFTAAFLVLTLSGSLALHWKIVLMGSMILLYAMLLLGGATEPEECHLVGRFRRRLLRLPCHRRGFR